MDGGSVPHYAVDRGDNPLGHRQPSSHCISNGDGTLANPDHSGIAKLRYLYKGPHGFIDLIKRNLDDGQHAVLVNPHQLRGGKRIIIRQVLGEFLFHAEAHRNLLCPVHDSGIRHDIQILFIPAHDNAASRIRLPDLLLPIEEIQNRLHARTGNRYHTGHDILNHIRHIQGCTDRHSIG